MATEFKLSYTASEIDEKLGKVDNLVSTVNGVAPDVNGNVNIEATGSSNGIIDVLELPTENINEAAFYRLMTARFICNQEGDSSLTCHCVAALPETGKVCTDIDMSFIEAYYNISDNTSYGYVDSELSTAIGISSGWYPTSALCEIANIPYGGVITDISADPCDGGLRILLDYDFYIYKNGWSLLPFAYEKMPEFDIQWDGVIGDRFALDISSLGFTNTYFVQVSDKVFTAEELVGAKFTQSDGSEYFLSDSNIDATTYAGGIDAGGGVMIVYSQDDLNTALGLPAGYITNGTYFVYIVDAQYTNRLVAPPKVIKIDSKYLSIQASDIDGLSSVAISGNYNDLYNQPTIHTDVVRYNMTQTLSSNAKSTARTNIDVYSKAEVDSKIDRVEENIYAQDYVPSWILNGYAKTTDVYSKSEVDDKIANGIDLSEYAKTTDVETMISEAIGSAIGGSY